MRACGPQVFGWRDAGKRGRPGRIGKRTAVLNLHTLSEKFRSWFEHLARTAPARLTLVVFAAIIALITGLLCLPIASASGKPAPFVDALFNATSAVCVTGLVTVDTATYWSPFGHFVLLAGIKVGGLGVMTLASILALAVSRHIGLTQRMLAATEKSAHLGDVASLIRAVIVVSFTVEIALAVVLFPRLLLAGHSVVLSAWYSIFMGVSIFNNGGFIILPEGLEVYAADWWMVMPIIVGTVIGAVGFPVALDVRRNWRRPRRLTLHSKLTLSTYLLLTFVGALVVGGMEWNNLHSLGSLEPHAKILTSILSGVNARSSGLATIPTGTMSQGTWFLEDILMFIGGGSASTAGGIKVTTLAVMALAILAEARGDRDIEVFRRRIPATTVRLSVAVVAIGAFLVGIATTLLLVITDFGLDKILFEVVSAFGTVGLSTGITPLLPPGAKLVLTAVMFTGRTGTMTLAAALALRERGRAIRMPEESPAIG